MTESTLPAAAPVLPDGTPLPPMYQATLDAASVEELVKDLTTVAEIVDVRVKAGPTARAEAGTIDLHRAVRSLTDGLVRGVQVTYRHERVLWMDTLMRLPSGVRLVRTRPIDDGSEPEPVRFG